MISNNIGKTISPAPKKHPSTIANRHGLAETTAIAAATASGLARREIGVKPQMSANTSDTSATVILTAMPSPERSAFSVAHSQRRSVVVQCDRAKGELLLLLARSHRSAGTTITSPF